MFEKHIPVGGYDDPAWGPSYYDLHSSTFEKIAGECFIPPDLDAFIKTCSPRDDGRFLMLNAIGAYESWGSNRNGDAYPEWSVRGDAPPAWLVEHVKAAGMRIPKEYGFKTFAKYARLFRHHKNKADSPVYGKVCIAAYNDRMHRAELVVFVEKRAAPDLVDRIDDGDLLAFSMGARLPWDMCSVPGCHHMARKPAEYCDHLKFAMNSTGHDGIKKFAYNFFPLFFDISQVTVPAEPTALGLKKVAQVMIVVPALPTQHNEVKIAAPKRSAMTKEVPPADRAQDPKPMSAKDKKTLRKLVGKDMGKAKNLPDPLLADLRRAGPGKAIPSLTAIGIPLKRDEAERAFGGMSMPSSVGTGGIDIEILRRLAKHAPGRSMLPRFLLRRTTTTIVAMPSKESGKSKTASPVYEDYVKLAANFSVDELRVAHQNPKVVLACDSTIIAEALVKGRTPDLDWRPYVAALVWNL